MEPLLIHLKMNDAQARARAHRAAAARRHHRRRAAARAISAPVLRRHAPARDDRDRACLQSEAHHRRRADHRARRHHPGADPRADEGPVAPARHRADHHHAQSRHRRALRRPRERDVRGAHRRAGLGRRCVPRSRASLFDRACCARCRGSTVPRGAKLETIEGLPPDLRAPPAGCRFAPRCPYRIDACAQDAAAAPRSTPGTARPASRASEIVAGTLVPPQRAAGAAARPSRKPAPSRCSIVRSPEEVLHREGRGAGFLSSRDGDREGGRRRVASTSAGRDARPGRRIRLRQDHGRPRCPPARRADRRRRSASAAPTSRMRATPRCAACGARSR